MAKWEYLRYWVQPYLEMWIAPASKANLQWLSQSYPSIKLEVDKDSQILNIFPQAEDWTEVHYAIIDHLGAEGWEPFAITELCIHFKRSR